MTTWPCTNQLPVSQNKSRLRNAGPQPDLCFVEQLDGDPNRARQFAHGDEELATENEAKSDRDKAFARRRPTFSLLITGQPILPAKAALAADFLVAFFSTVLDIYTVKQ